MNSAQLKQPRSARKAESQTWALSFSGSSASASEQATVATEAKRIESYDPSLLRLWG
jgi:hypothetical protein